MSRFADPKYLHGGSTFASVTIVPAPDVPTLTAPSTSAARVGDTITVSATTTDSPTRVDWILYSTSPDVDGTVIATDSTISFSQSWTIASSVGNYSLIARSVNGGGHTDSSAISFTVFPNTVAFWFDADDLSATPVTSWGHVVTLTEATNPPTYEATGWNGKKSVLFNGSNNRLTGSSSLGSGNDVAFYGVYAVQRVATTANRTGWSFGNSGSASPFFEGFVNATPSFAWRKQDDTAAGASRANTAANTNRNIFSLSMSGTALDTWINGSVDLSAVALNVGVTTLDQFTLGCLRTNTSTQFANVRFRRGVFGTGTLDSSTRGVLETWANG